MDNTKSKVMKVYVQSGQYHTIIEIYEGSIILIRFNIEQAFDSFELKWRVENYEWVLSTHSCCLEIHSMS